MARIAVISNLRLQTRSDAMDVVQDISQALDRFDILAIPGDLGSRDVVTVMLLHLGILTPVVYVPGLFECDSQKENVLAWLAELQPRMQSAPHSVEVLLNRQVVVGGVSFVGGPLWVHPEKVHRNYLRRGNYSDASWRRYYGSQHDLGMEYLDSTVSPYDVVITYTPPIRDVLPLNVLGTNLQTFVSPNAKDLVAKLSPRAWISSNLEPFELDCGQTRFVSNPKEEGSSRLKLKTFIV